MLEREQAKGLSQQVLSRCGNDAAELVLIYKEHALTRFANNGIHQNVSEQNLTLYLRLLHDKRRGTASTNRSDPEALDDLISRARTNAAASPEEPDFLGLANPADYVAVESFDHPTALNEPDSRAERVGIVCRLAQEKGFNASGAFSIGASATCVANSNHLFAYHSISEADFQTTVMMVTASMGLLLAEEINRRGIRDKINLKKITIGSERSSDAMRSFVISILNRTEIRMNRLDGPSGFVSQRV